MGEEVGLAEMAVAMDVPAAPKASKEKVRLLEAGWRLGPWPLEGS